MHKLNLLRALLLLQLNTILKQLWLLAPHRRRDRSPFTLSADRISSGVYLYESYRRLARGLLNEPVLNADFIKQRDFLQFSDREHAVLRHRGAPPLVSLYIVHSGIFPYLSPLQVSTFRGSRQLSGLLSPEEILSL